MGVSLTLRVAKKAVDRTLYFLLRSRWIAYRARLSWDRRAVRDPRTATAAHAADNWEHYWDSGVRDFDRILGTARQAGPMGDELAVEIGCGLGRLARVAAEQFSHVIALDISDKMLKLARQQAAARNVTYAAIGPSFSLPVDGSSADLVYAWTVFRHVAKPIFAGYVEEAARVLKPGAYLVFEAQIREGALPTNPFPTETYREREYTRAELLSYAARYGFDCAADQMIPSITPDTSNLIVAWRKGQVSGSGGT